MSGNLGYGAHFGLAANVVTSACCAAGSAMVAFIPFVDVGFKGSSEDAATYALYYSIAYVGSMFFLNWPTVCVAAVGSDLVCTNFRVRVPRRRIKNKRLISLILKTNVAIGISPLVAVTMSTLLE